MMRRSVIALLVVVIMTTCSVSPESLRDHDVSSVGTSQLNLSFSNGPGEGEDVTGIHTISFVITGNGTASSIEIEISSDGENWTAVTNLTGTPWLTHFDSTAYTNGTWILRARAWDSNVSDTSIWFTSGNFNIVNQVPVITSFELTNSGTGSGTSSTNRAWYNISTDGTLYFTWTATDDDLAYASLANVPGPGTPSDDGPGTIANGWDWASGSFSEGTWNPRLTVWDDSGLYATKTMFIGIDRSAPTLTSPTIGDGGSWSDSTSVLVSGLSTAADDGSGSGISHVEINSDGTWESVIGDSTTLTLAEGLHSISMRPVDNVGNIGTAINVNINVDVTDPEGAGWIVDELTTSRVGSANLSFTALDDGSGIDLDECQIQFGFDLNGVGNTPDQTGIWLDIPETGLNGSIGLTNWATKSRQYLMLRAVVTDVAGNSITTVPTAFQILPGLDLMWNSSSTTLDRLVVRPGDTNGLIQITSTLESNQNWGGSFTVSLLAAPADRSADVDWVTMETRLMPSGTLSDSTEEILWNYTVPNTGQYDLRLSIDPSNAVDERDEGNNNFHLVVTGADVTNSGTVPSFAPSILAIILTGLLVSWLQKKE